MKKIAFLVVSLDLISKFHNTNDWPARHGTHEFLRKKNREAGTHYGTGRDALLVKMTCTVYHSARTVLPF